MKYSAAFLTSVHAEAAAHLLRRDRQEDLCFALWYPSRGQSRTSALIQRLVLPQTGERAVHGNASFSAQYFQRAIGEAMRAGAGLAFLHSHPAPGWQGMSDDDLRAEEGHAAAVLGDTQLPFVGLTLGTDGAWSSRFWEKVGPQRYRRQWCESTRVVGERLMVTYHDGLVPRPSFRPDLSRTISAWGENAQRSIARLRIGIAGAGSVGFLVAEALARMGCTFLRLFDFDRVEEVNLDRLIYATKDDARLRRPKVEVLAEALRRSATADRFQVEPLQWSVVEVEGYRSALDGDVLFSCVDRPWPRSVLNLIASAHLIPVVDGGIAVTVKVTTATMRGADWRAHIAAPGRRCLECLGEYNPGDVSAEREGYFDDPAYIRSLDDGHFIKRKQNVFAFSMSAASFEILQFLSMIVAPFGVSKTGAQLYHFVTGRLDHDFSGCNEGCLFPGVTAKGDLSGLVMTGRHRAAEDARHQTTAAASGRSWFRRWLWPW